MRRDPSATAQLRTQHQEQREGREATAVRLSFDLGVGGKLLELALFVRRIDGLIANFGDARLIDDLGVPGVVRVGLRLGRHGEICGVEREVDVRASLVRGGVVAHHVRGPVAVDVGQEVAGRGRGGVAGIVDRGVTVETFGGARVELRKTLAEAVAPEEFVGVAVGVEVAEEEPRLFNLTRPARWDARQRLGAISP